MTALDPRPAPAPARGDTHLVCCRPNRSLCNIDMSQAGDVPDAAALTCADCSLIDESGDTCGAVLCRLRQWLRGTFGRPR